MTQPKHRPQWIDDHTRDAARRYAFSVPIWRDRIARALAQGKPLPHYPESVEARSADVPRLLALADGDEIARQGGDGTPPTERIAR